MPYPADSVRGVEGVVTLSSLFAAIANDDRLAILSELRRRATQDGGGMSISEVALAIGTTRFGASHHLSVLRSVGLVVAHREGNRFIQTLAEPAFEVIEDWIYRFIGGSSVS